MNENPYEENPSPYLKASNFSKCTYSWIGELIGLGAKEQLDLKDLYSPYTEIQCKTATDELELEWEKEREKNPEDSNILRPLKKLYMRQFVFNSLYIIFQELLKIFQPLFIALILRYFNGTITLQTTMIYAGIISVLAAVGGVLHHPYYYNAYKHGMKTRLALGGLMYRKILRVGSTHFDSQEGGDVANLLTNDTDRVEKAITFLMYLFVGPLQIIVVVSVILSQIGWTFLAGLFFLFALMPIKALLAGIYNKFRLKNCRISDMRIVMTTEILSAIKIIKMYCWEIPFTDKATQLRNKELKFQLFLNVMQAVSYSIDNTMALLMTFMNISIFISFTDLPLLPSFIVFSLGFYVRLCYSIGFNFSRSTSALITGLVSLKRINDFLLLDELPPANERFCYGDEVSVKVEKLCFSWKNEGKENNEPRNKKKTTKPLLNLNNVSVDLKDGEMLAIIGPVGAGKSTLLLGIIGELSNYTGLIDVKGKVAYISQQAWIFTASIKQNILFGNEWDKEKFDRICEVCSLKKDLDLLPFAEDTLAAERGINLSGGQRARISMARALYSDADIFLFDDSLSAVDAPVAKFLLNNCINGYLKNKIRILVTHHAQHLEYADKVIILNDGKVEAQGSYADIKNFNLSSLELKSDKNPNQKDEYDEAPEGEAPAMQAVPPKEVSAEDKAKQEANKKSREEGQQQGSVTWKTYFMYFTGGGSFFGILTCIAVAIMFLSAQSCMIMTDFWLSTWSTNEENYMMEVQRIRDCLVDDPTKSNSHACETLLNSTQIAAYQLHEPYPDRAQYYYIYLALAFTSVLLIFIRSVLYFLMCVRVSRKVYEKLFKSVKDTPVKFFELNPLGRILNRFTKDTNNMDDMISIFIFEFLHLIMIVSGALIVPFIINYLIIIPFIPVSFVFLYIRNYFVKSGQQIKRLENIARSPILIHANSTVEGISTIRCSAKEEILCHEFEQHCDMHTRAFYCFYVAQRWFGLRLDILCSMFTIGVLFLCIFLKDYINLSTGKIGILMCYLFQLFDLFQWCVIMTTIIENLMTSVERIIEYTQLPTEHVKTVRKKVPADWPSKGHIVFDKVSLSYDKNLPNVLKEISVNINPSEKVGIVGRTGAGKSSFFQTIFRMYEPEGSIRIDGIDIKTLSLFELRTRLTIIPQEPILFSGTVRYNLDPFGVHDDLDLWNALESVNMKSVIQEIKGRLDSNVTQGGSNLSVGQKQLFCLARAILKKTKILIIDEATANVDYKTDAIIQQAIREQFKECTVLTIAHRLSTVVDNDRILCLSEGKIKNFGKPIDLLMDESTVLFELTKKLSRSERQTLFDIVNKNATNESQAGFITLKGKAEFTATLEEEEETSAHVNSGADIKEDE